MVDAPSKPCHNCRRQRLRCDRSVPHCNKCASLGKECLGYGQLFRWTGAVASRGKLAGRTSSAPVDGQLPKLNYVLPAPTPFSTSSTTTSVSSTCSSPSSSSPSDCNMQLVKAQSPPSVFNPEFSSPYVLVDPLFQDLDSSHRHYLSYFTSRLCKDLVSHDLPERNPFRGLLPLTKAHPLLQHIIVAASAAHMSNLVKASAPSGNDSAVSFSYDRASRQALRDALVAKAKALRLMHTAIQDIESTGGDVALAAALFFVNVELIESGKHGWRAHLEGAGRIMSLLQPASGSDDGLRDYLVSDCFIYFILASAFMPMTNSMQKYFQASQIPLSLERATDNSYLCCPPEILQILHSASHLSTVQDGGVPREEIVTQGVSLIQQALDFDIATWAQNIRNVSYLQDVPVKSRIHAGNAHRLAACLYILQAVPEVADIIGSDATVSLSNDIFEQLSSIPDDDPNFKATSWPTFIAGAEAMNNERRIWVMDRLKRLVVLCPWGFLYTAMEALPVIWGLEDKGSRNWLQALRDPDLNFLIV